MNRRFFITTSTISFFTLIACNNKQKNSYTHYLESEIGKITTLKGEIIHVCPIEGQKMKLQLPDGEVICILPSNGEPFLKKQWDKKKVKISGMLKEKRFMRNTILTNYQDKKLLCHIDYTPCIDTKWIENRQKDGSAERLLERDNELLLGKMQTTKLNYIQVFSLTADEIVEV